MSALMKPGCREAVMARLGAIGLFSTIVCGLIGNLAAEDAVYFRGALLDASQVVEARLLQLKRQRVSAVVVRIEDPQSKYEKLVQSAARQVRQAELELFYWIEVARCPSMADENPTWMASQQTHPEWRRLHPDAPVPSDDEVIKTYPWVPILSRETFEAHRERVQTLLERLPQSKGVFLNDLQGAPSACGCGNLLCRWTSDYGKRRSTVPLSDEAPALFVSQLSKLFPQVDFVPVWTTECEEHDGAKDGMCAGVGCFNGICWKALTAQLAPVASAGQKIGLLVPYKDFQRDLPIYGQPAGWIAHAVSSLAEMPSKYNRSPVEAGRVITVLQGWEVTDEEIAAQIRVAEQADVGGYIVAHAKIEQSWEPRLVRWK